MQCPLCGYDNEPERMRCRRCGARLASRSAGNPYSQPANIPTPAPAGDRTVRQDATTVMPVAVKRAAKAKPGRTALDVGATNYNPVSTNTASSRFPWWAGLFLLVLLAALIFAGIELGTRFINDRNEAAAQEAAYAAAHVPASLKVGFDIPDYIQGASSPIPVRITGNDIDGNAIDTLSLMDMNDREVTLTRGAYTFTPVGSPITSAGGIFTVPTAAKVVYDENGVSIDGQAAEAGAGPTFRYELIPIADVTDEQIDAARVWMTDAGLDPAVRQGWLDAIYDHRRELSTEARTEADRAALEEASHIVTDAFEFTLPEFWWGKVDVEQGTDASKHPCTYVYLSGTKQPLCQVIAVPAADPELSGDEMNHLAASVTEGSTRVEVWSRNWAAVAASEQPGVSDSTLNRLIRLVTGGEMNLNNAQDAGEDVGTPDVDYLREALAPTITVYGRDWSSDAAPTDDQAESDDEWSDEDDEDWDDWEDDEWDDDWDEDDEDW